MILAECGGGVAVIRNVIASGATLSGRCPVFPGKAVEVSMMEPVFPMWWLRPVSSAIRVGEQSAVVWNWLYRSPPLARRSTVGMSIGPPKALDWPNPISSISTMSTFGAPAGALTSNRGGGLAFLTSSSVLCGYWAPGWAGPCGRVNILCGQRHTRDCERYSNYFEGIHGTPLDGKPMLLQAVTIKGAKNNMM